LPILELLAVLGEQNQLRKVLSEWQNLSDGELMNREPRRAGNLAIMRV